MTSAPVTDRGIRAGVRRLFRLPPRTADGVRADADAELDAFLEERVEYLVRRGMTPAAARTEALRRLGGTLSQVRDALRESADRREQRRRLRDTLDELAQDVRYAGRQIARAPGFTAVAVLTLALGIGANTAIFSVVHRLLLAPLPYPNGDRIVMPMMVLPAQEDERFSRLSAPMELVRPWQARARTVQAIAGASENLFSVQPDGTIDTIPSAMITANFLPTLGVRPVVGRGFAPTDERPDGQAAVAMISHALWRRAYGGRADVLGKAVSLEGRPLTIVGVTPPGLNIPLSRNPAPDVWVPGPLESAGAGGSGSLMPAPSVFATLRPGVTADEASRELRAIARTVPDTGEIRFTRASQAVARVMRAQDFLSARETRAIQVLFFAVGALLLIACANVASLLLARAWTRQREFAVRGALGAGHGRLARQVLTESVALAMAGGLLGVGVAWLALRVIVALRPPALDHLADVRLEPAVLLWTLGVSVATGVLFGSAPALLPGSQTAGDVLRRETRGGSPGRASVRMRSALIVLEIAASLVLLVGSGLFVRSFTALQRMPLGFEPRGLVYTDVLIAGPRNRDRKPALRDAIVRRLRATPGVTGVAIGTMPGKGFVAFGGLEAETDHAGHTATVPTLGTVFITPDYFQVAHIALLAGRLPDSLAAATGKAAPLGLSPEVMVNREFARRVWPHGGAIGARVREAPGGSPGARVDPWSTVVGVVDNTRMPEVRGDVAALQVYSLVPPRLGDVPLVVRTAASGDVTAPAIKHAIASVDPTLFVRPMLSGDTYLRNGLAPTRFAMALLTAFSAIALALAAVGLYAVVAYGVTQRTREIGVRIALGAEPRAIVAGVVGDGLRLAAGGVVIGVAVAVAATRVLTSMLYAVRPADPLTFAGAALLVTTVALLASYVPARRALRIDPTEALRAD